MFFLLKIINENIISEKQIKNSASMTSDRVKLFVLEKFRVRMIIYAVIILDILTRFYGLYSLFRWTSEFCPLKAVWLPLSVASPTLQHYQHRKGSNQDPQDDFHHRGGLHLVLDTVCPGDSVVSPRNQAVYINFFYYQKS